MISKQVTFVSVLLFALLGALADGASAQSFKATIVGTVVDTTGGVLPGVTVTAVSEGTGQTATTTTSSEGTFSLLQLPPGRYVLTVELNGFRKFVQSGVVLETDQVRRVAATLEVGDIAEAVTVAAPIAFLNTDTSNKGELITA